MHPVKNSIAAIAAGIALSGSAHAYVVDGAIVRNSADCPEGTEATVPVYEWREGRFARVGWRCESIYRDRGP
jgi:hypothetical protein